MLQWGESRTTSAGDQIHGNTTGLAGLVKHGLQHPLIDQLIISGVDRMIEDCHILLIRCCLDRFGCFVTEVGMA